MLRKHTGERRRENDRSGKCFVQLASSAVVFMTLLCFPHHDVLLESKGVYCYLQRKKKKKKEKKTSARRRGEAIKRGQNPRKLSLRVIRAGV